MGYLTVSDIFPIYPHIEAAIHTFKIQKCLCRIHILCIRKGMHISSTRYILWDIWWVKWKWIADICILVCIISCHLPYARNLDLVKCSGVISHLIKSILHIINTFKILEFPFSI